MRGIALALAFALIAGRAVAADYYVKNGGSDGANGLSIATAWETLQHAADTVGAGDTVRVLDGDYEGFDLRTSGTPGSPITFIADGSNVRITEDNPVTPDGINVENCAHVVIDGFIVDERTRTGIRAAVAEFITIRNCSLGNNGKWGILTGFVDDLLIENNVAYGSVIEHGIYVSNSGDRPTIRNNHVYDNNANGIHMNGDASLGGDGIISNALVERNIIHGNGVAGGSGINMDGVRDSVVRNNLLYDNHASGISLYRIDGGSGSRNNVVVNNTVLSAADGRWCINISNGSTDNWVANNILYTDHSFRGVITIDPSSRSNFVSDYNSVRSRFSLDGGNTVVNLATWQGEGYDLNSFIATPSDHFIVPGSNFHLLTNSPAVDAGTISNAPTSDLDGNPRPIGGGVDLGAYELALPDCGDGDGDPGEMCGEPGLPVCGDPCTSCQGCLCTPSTPICGDALVCGGEECEDDGDCGGGQVCSGCACVNPPPCGSGIAASKPTLHLRANPFLVRFKGEAVIPKPWVGIDPVANGVRFVVDSPSGAGGVDLTVPAGALWHVNAAGTRWSYRDPSGAAGGVVSAVIRDLSHKQDGLVRWVVRAKTAGSVTLPPVAVVRGSALLGNASECAAAQWNPPAAIRPRCDGDAALLRCR